MGFFTAGVHWATVVGRWAMRTLTKFGLHPYSYPVGGPAAAAAAGAVGGGSAGAGAAAQHQRRKFD